MREGRNPWRIEVWTNNPGFASAERQAMADVARFPPPNPIVLVVRCDVGRSVMVARERLDADFSDENVVRIPVPCDLVVVVKSAEAGIVMLDRHEWMRMPRECRGITSCARARYASSVAEIGAS